MTTQKMVGVSPETFKSLLDYLGARPYNEVALLLDSLKSALTLDVTIKEPETAPDGPGEA